MANLAWWRPAVVVVVVSLLAACATGAPARPVHDLTSIAGKWEGTVMTHRGPQPLTMVFDQGGRMVSHSAQGPINATITLKDGKILYRTEQGAAGTITLHEDGRRRVLKGSRDDGTFPFELQPAP